MKPVLCVLLAAALACAPGPVEQPDLLLVTVDTLRADVLGCLGYPRPSTPTLDRLAQEGVLYTRHYTTCSQTAPAHASLFSGLMPQEHGLCKNGQFVDPKLPWLPEQLSARGYDCAAAIGALVLSSDCGFARGFAHFDQDMRGGRARSGAGPALFERPAAQVVDSALAWLERSGNQPVFLWVHLFDPHDPYAPPDGALLDGPADLAFFRQRAEPSAHFERELLAHLWAGYEAEVRYADAELARLLQVWDARQRQSLVVVTADHGEGLGEHGYQGHDFYLYEEQAQVPLIVRARGPQLERALPAGTRVLALSSALDLCGALQTWLGFEASAAVNPLVRHALAPQADPAARALLQRREFSDFDLQHAPAIQHLLREHQGQAGGARGALWALVGPDHKLLEAVDVGPEFFDLERDAAEQHNLAQSSAAEVQADFRAQLDARRAALRLAPRAADLPLDPQALARQRELLEALGY